MSRQRHRPPNATAVGTYDALDQWARAFAGGHLNLLLLIGAPGLQKSELMRQAAGPAALWLQGHVTAFEMYRELYRHRGELVVIDDVESLCADRESVRLLRDLCESRPVKTISWHSATSKLAEEGIEKSFTTDSKVAIIGNAWATLNPSVAALEDRAHVVFFQPTAEEVHRRTAAWFTDQEIYAFVEANLHLIARPSMRHYKRAQEMKQAGLPWRDHLLELWLPSHRARLAAQLLADPTFATQEERAAAFVARGGGDRSTFFRRAAFLRPPRARPLSPKPPPGLPPAVDQSPTELAR
jgi:hypothetical protein